MSSELTELSALYAQKNFGARIDFGQVPAILVIDFQCNEIHEEHNWLEKAVQNTRSLLAEARKKRIPIIYTVVAYDPTMRDGGLFVKKITMLQKRLVGNVVVHPDVAPEPDDMVLVKKYSSAFFGTHLSSTLKALQVDTLIVTGCATSGCIRATTIDAISEGYRTIVVSECVADRAPLSHEVALIEIDARYADVVLQAEAELYIRQLPERYRCPASRENSRPAGENQPQVRRAARGKGAMSRGRSG